MGANPLIDQYFKNLIAVQQYRMRTTQLHSMYPETANFSVGAGYPSALQLAMEVMRDKSPIGTNTLPAPNTQSGSSNGPAWWEVTKKPGWMPDWAWKASHFNPAALGATGIVKGLSAVAETGPAKWVIENMSRPMYGAGSLMSEIGTQADKSGENKLEYFLKMLSPTETSANSEQASSERWNALKEGLTLGANKVDPGTAIFGPAPTTAPEDMSFGQGIEGLGRFAADVALDPLSYVGIGGVTKASKIKAPTEVLTADKIIQKLPEVKPEQLAIAGHSVAIPRFTAGATGISDRLSPVQLADEITANSLAQTIKGMPVLAHPNLEVAPLYRDITTTTTEKVPKVVTEQYKELEQTTAPTVTTPTVTTPPVNRALSEHRAIKMAMLQSPEYKVGGQFTVSELLRHAVENPEHQAEIERILNNEVKSIYKSRKLPEGISPVIKLGAMGRSGTHEGTFGLTLKQATQLIHEGKIPTGTTKAEFTHQFPFHDPQDFASATLKNAKGQVVPLSQYLEDLGVHVRPVKPTESILPEVAGDTVFSAAPPSIPKYVTKTRTKTVYEEIPRTTTKVERLSQAESMAWALQHQGVLSKDEINYLRAARNRESFLARVKELSTKQVAGDFKTLQEVVDAHKAGLVPEESFQKILDILGAKNADAALKKAQQVFKLKSAPKKTVAGKTTPPKMERLKGTPVNDPWQGAKPVTQIINDASRGNFEDFARPVPHVTQQVVSDLVNAVPEAVAKNLKRVLDPNGKYRWETTIKHTKRTSPKAGLGVGRNLHGWNKYSQSDVFRAITTEASKRLFTIAHGKHGADFYRALNIRAGLMYDQVMDAMRTAELALKRDGVKIVAGTDNSGLLMSLTDVLDHMDRKVVQKWLFSSPLKSNPNIHVTRIMDAAEGYVQAALNGGSMGLARENALSLLNDLRQGERLGKAKPEELVNTIEAALPGILKRVNANYAEAAIKTGTAVQSMTDGVIGTLLKKYTDPNIPVADAFKDLMDRDINMSKIGQQIGAPADSLAHAKVIGNSELAVNGVSAGDLAEAASANQMKSASTVKDAAKIGRQQQKSRAAEAAATANGTYDLADTYETALQNGIFRANAPMLDKVVAIKDMLGRAFYAPYGHDDMHFLVHRGRNAAQEFSRFHHQLMSNAFNIAISTYGADQAGQKLAEAFKLLQSGAVVKDAELAPVVNAIKHSTDIMFGGRDAAFPVRNGIFASEVNRHLDFFGVPGEYRIADNLPLVQQAQVWRQWNNVADPLDLLDRVHAAYQSAAVKSTIGRDTSRLWGKTDQLPGYVKITDKSGRSNIFPYMDSELYYPREIVEQLPHLDRFMDDSLFRTNSQLLKMYDKTLHAYKAGLTIYWPSHHVRNIIGDMGLSFLAGVTNVQRYWDGMRILAGRSGMYGKDWDLFKSLLEGSPEDAMALQKGTGKTTALSVGRGKVQVTDDQIFRAMTREGLLPGYTTMEDIAFNAEQGMERAVAGRKVSLTTPFAGHVRDAAGGLSQARDHWVRAAHFVDVIKKGHWNSLDEAFTEAGKVVRKWHPDGSDLTAFERKVMRRIIPFYSWFRKAIPLVVESMALRPGRAMVVPKASYAMAQVMGVNPDSLGDPFPENMLFPSWLKENILGPQWQGEIALNLGPLKIPFGRANGQLYGMNPGDPISDVGSSYLSKDGIKQVLGSMTPIIRVPIEAATGNSLGTGTPITDWNEYADQQIPGLSVATSITGIDPLGGDKLQTVQKGYRPEGFDPVAFMNRLTGLGVKSYNKPNYVRGAQLEQRDRMRSQARQARNG